MTARLKTSKPDTVETNCTLVPIVFTDEELKENFPNAVFGYKGLACTRESESEPLAYLCMELPPGPACTLHLWIPKENRTQDTIAWLVQVFYRDVHPWVKAEGKSCIVVNCHYDLIKTRDLFKTFGFDPVPIWLGVMPVN